MANALYDKGREGILDRTIDVTADLRVCLVKSTYAVDIASDQFMSAITASDNGRSAALSSKTYTAGVLDAADTTITATDAEQCSALVIFQHTGDDATARLIAYIDTPLAGLPFTPSTGQVVDITWDNGANRIFKL